MADEDTAPEADETTEDGETEQSNEEAPQSGESSEQKSGDSSSIDNLEDALKEIKKLRKENAERRTKGKEVEEAAQKWKEHVDSQKSESEKLQEDYNTAVEELNKYRKAEKQRSYAEKHEIDPELSDLIEGDSDEEMDAKAEKLAKRLNKEEDKKKKSNKASASDVGAGRRNQNNELPTKSEGKFLRDLMEGKT